MAPGRCAALIGISLFLWLSPAGVQADRSEARAHVDLARRLLSAGESKAALERLDMAISADPDYQPAYRLAIPLWFETGQLGSAVRHLEHLTLRCRSCSFAWYALAGAYRKAGRHRSAILAYETYLSQQPGDPDALFGLGMSLRATRDPRANEVLRRYLEREARPERAELRERVAQLLGAPLPAPALAAPGGSSPHMVALRREMNEAREQGAWHTHGLCWLLLQLWGLSPAPQ